MFSVTLAMVGRERKQGRFLKITIVIKLIAILITGEAGQSEI